MSDEQSVIPPDAPGLNNWPARVGALFLCVLGLPGVLGLGAVFTDAPVTVGQPSPRTIIAPEETRVVDQEATDIARRQAADSIEPVISDNLEAQASLILFVNDAFSVAVAVRAAGVDGQIPSRSQQIDALSQRLPMLDEDAVGVLVSLTDSELQTARTEAVEIAQTAASAELLEGEVEQYAEGPLRRQLALSTVGPAVASSILEPILREALRPTITVDQAATAAARQMAAADIDEVEVPFRRGLPIVRAGETVTPVQHLALVSAGLEGRDPWIEVARALLLSVILTAVVAAYLRTYRPLIWAHGKHLLLLAFLLVMFTAIAVAVNTVQLGGNERHFLIPVGAIAMLATVLFDARVGVLIVIPVTALMAYIIPGLSGLVPFAAVSGLLSIPLVGRLTARGQLRTAAWQSTVAYTALAGAFSLVYSGTDGLVPALAFGAANGVLTALIVNGLLPFLESLFGVITATSLLDFADRNHPLLRELEAKAIGTYNHSVMVATLASRACRRIEADALLAEVMALYHDIGKVAKPYFFVENQVGIANPHDQLGDPRQSALIIQRHVTDGIEMATVHKLPPEIVDGIRTHHGTTVVAYFYRQALKRADEGLAAQPDEQFFRYKGRRPFTREQAVLMLSDCTEGAVRAASSAEGAMNRDTITAIVSGLIADRVADGQLDDSPLTFADLRAVELSLIEGLEGVYHPRIQYPKDPKKTVEVVDKARRETEVEAKAAEAADEARARATEPADAASERS
ncbi:MAG TPA: HDIG domain-containing protein [Euzebya sp.]|nr:HDIG domain-containing protein [Euzebya sp.]